MNKKECSVMVESHSTPGKWYIVAKGSEELCRTVFRAFEIAMHSTYFDTIGTHVKLVMPSPVPPPPEVVVLQHCSAGSPESVML
jgi:hypothetical protein